LEVKLIGRWIEGLHEGSRPSVAQRSGGINIINMNIDINVNINIDIDINIDINIDN